MVEAVFTNRSKGKNGQPEQAWYGWEIFYPSDFPYAERQARGGVQFASFKHTVYCASMYLVHQSGHDDDDLIWRITRYTGASPKQVSEQCKLVQEAKVARMRDLLGKWTRFELFVKWSQQSDGEFRLYINGKQKLAYHGVTCTNDCDQFNQFNYGIYLSNAPSRDSIAKTYVLFKNVDRAASREALAFNK
jgi:Polysaccharide lyase